MARAAALSTRSHPAGGMNWIMDGVRARGACCWCGGRVRTSTSTTTYSTTRLPQAVPVPRRPGAAAAAPTGVQQEEQVRGTVRAVVIVTTH